MRALWIGLQHMLEKVLFQATLSDLLQKLMAEYENRYGEMK